jgi:hypothetical protein
VAPARGGGQSFKTLPQTCRSARPREVTSKASTGDVEELKTAGFVGINTAVSWWPPTASVEVVVVATPLLTTAGLPKLTVPSLNCTVPTAVAGEMVAIRVTLVLWDTGEAGFVVSAVLVAVARPAAPVPVTTNSTGGEVEPVNAAGLTAGDERRGQQAPAHSQLRG